MLRLVSLESEAPVVSPVHLFTSRGQIYTKLLFCRVQKNSVCQTQSGGNNNNNNNK